MLRLYNFYARAAKRMAAVVITVLLLLAVGGAAFGLWQLVKPGPPCKGTACGAPALAGPPDLTASTSATFRLSDSAGSLFVCALDRAPLAQCPVTIHGTSVVITYPGPLAFGPHLFRVAGITGSKTGPVTLYSWTVDAHSP